MTKAEVDRETFAQSLSSLTNEAFHTAMAAYDAAAMSREEWEEFSDAASKALGPPRFPGDDVYDLGW